MFSGSISYSKFFPYTVDSIQKGVGVQASEQYVIKVVYLVKHGVYSFILLCHDSAISVNVVNGENVKAIKLVDAIPCHDIKKEMDKFWLLRQHEQ